MRILVACEHSGKWKLDRCDGYWFWTRNDTEESPIFCTKALALAWLQRWKKLNAAKVPERMI